MFEDVNDRLSDHMNHGATTFAGLVTMVNSSTVLSVVGALVGIGGLLCSISREVRGFLDRRDARRGKG